MEPFKFTGGGHIYQQKTIHFELNSVYAKNNAHSIMVLYTKCLTLWITFLYLKNSALCVMFLSKMYCIVFLITNYKRTYDQRNQTDK